MTVLVAVAAGVLLGYLAGGRLSHIGETDLAHLWLLGAAGAVNTLNGWMPAARDWALAQGIPLLVVSYEVIAVWAVRNIGAGPRRARVPLVLGAAGAACNAAVITSNGLMPVLLPPQWAQAAASGGALDAKHAVMTPHTLLPWLGDVFPLFGGRVMFSFGDVLLAIGFAELITVLMTGDRHRWSAAGVPRTVRP